MGHFLKRSINFFAIPILLLIIAGACDKDMSIILDNSTTDNVGVSYIDSFTVNTSTVQLKNLPTFATGNIIVGKATVANIGTIKSTSYFRLGFSSAPTDIPEDATFDSLNLVLSPNYTHYYFGDTTKTQKISVHEITEALELKTLYNGPQNNALPIYVTGASLFSDQKFAYAPTSLGTLAFVPHIKASDTLYVKLNTTLGQTFFDLMKNSDMKVSSNENFQEYFKGLALVPDETNTAALGFSDTLKVNVNYSYTGTDGFKKSGVKTLSVTNKAYQYNNIEYDRSGTAFEALSATDPELNTSATAGITYVQAGSGVVAKLTFPSLKQFMQDENLAINKAELIIETSSSSNTVYPIPSSLILYVADYNGIPTSYIPEPYYSDSYGRSVAQNASYIAGKQLGENGTYTFNMIAYLKALKASTTYDETSLYLSTTQANLLSTFNTAFIATEDEKPKIKLNILYTKFR